MKNMTQGVLEMSRIKGPLGVLGVAVLMVVIAACGNETEPPAGMGVIAPDLRLMFNEVEYTGVEVLGAANPDGSIVCCGTPIDMELVGNGVWQKPDGDASVEVYWPKDGGTTDVYTFHPSQTLSEVEDTPPEDEADTSPATWTRWAAK